MSLYSSPKVEWIKLLSVTDFFEGGGEFIVNSGVWRGDASRTATVRNSAKWPWITWVWEGDLFLTVDAVNPSFQKRLANTLTRLCTRERIMQTPVLLQLIIIGLALCDAAKYRLWERLALSILRISRACMYCAKNCACLLRFRGVT